MISNKMSRRFKFLTLIIIYNNLLINQTVADYRNGKKKFLIYTRIIIYYIKTVKLKFTYQQGKCNDKKEKSL